MFLPQKSQKLLILCFILTAVFFAFLPTLHNGFVNTWDDEDTLTANIYTHSLTMANIKTIFSTKPFHSYLSIPYIPLTLLSYCLEHQFFGYDPYVYHLDNLLLHLAIVALIFIFAQKTGFSIACAALSSLLFGLHPMHVESVAWVTERKDVLYAFFYLLALCTYMDYLKNFNKTSYLLTLLWGLLSILAKPMALSLPLILWLCDWWSKRSWNPRILLEKIPILLYMIVISWITYTKYMKPIHVHGFERVLVWIWSFIFYMEKFLFPRVLLPHYQLPQPVLFFHPAYTGAVVLFIVCLYATLRFRRHRVFTFAWLYYFLSIFFLIRFENVILAGNLSIVADRFMYLPSLGFCLLLGVIVEKLFYWCGQKSFVNKIICTLGIGLVFVVLAAKTTTQNKIWKNDISLWSYLISKAPNDPLGYVDRALAYKKSHQYNLAVADDSKAIEINPHYYISSWNASYRYPKSVDDTNLALANNPFLVVAYQNRGLLYKEMGKKDLALKDFNKVLSIDPQNVAVRKAESR